MTLVCETDCDVCHPKRNSRCRGPVQVEIRPLLALPDDYEIQILSDICSTVNDSTRSKGQVGEDKEPNGFKTWPFFFSKWKNRTLARLQVSCDVRSLAPPLASASTSLEKGS